MNINKLEFFPLSFFSVIMGLAGYTIVWQKLEVLLNWSNVFSTGFLYCVSSLFLLIFFAYLYKYFTFPKAVATELNHPIKLSFAPTFSISIILLSIAFYELAPSFSKYLWLAVLVYICFLQLPFSQFGFNKLNLKSRTLILLGLFLS